MVKVALLRVEDYDYQKVEDAIRRGLALLDIGEDFFQGKEVLLKPNLLAPAPLEKPVCSHPSVVRGMARVAQEGGGKVGVGDSPGLGSVQRVARACGLTPLLQELGVPLLSFEDKVEKKFPEGGICKAFPLTSLLEEKEVLVNLARLKTHNLTRYTGAVKNLYGCIPGHQKGAYHLRFNQVENFHKMLGDLLGLVRPPLSLVDGIVSMEGPGPRRGNPRSTGFLVMSRDAVAADVMACRLVGINPEEVLHLKHAGEMEFGVTKYQEIELVGDPEEELRVQGFQQSQGSGAPTGIIPPFLANLMRDLFIFLPRVIPDQCKACGVCVESCPAEVITMDKEVARIDTKNCIRCYCCQELCPHEAIVLERSFTLKGILKRR